MNLKHRYLIFFFNLWKYFFHVFSCWCPEGDLGPRCQQRTRSFHGDGWAWYAPLEVCAESHLSLEFITTSGDGQILYNGPITPPKEEEIIISGHSVF